VAFCIPAPYQKTDAGGQKSEQFPPAAVETADSPDLIFCCHRLLGPTHREKDKKEHHSGAIIVTSRSERVTKAPHQPLQLSLPVPFSFV